MGSMKKTSQRTSPNLTFTIFFQENYMKKITIFLGISVLAAIVLAGCGSKNAPSTKEYVLTTELKDGNLIFLGVSDEINGLANPTLTAVGGETITVTLINGGMGQHDVTFPELNATTGIVKEKGEEASVTFMVPNAHGEIEY